MRILLLAVTTFFSLCAQSQTVTGNVLVTLNYIHNKPDAGATILLLNEKKSFLNGLGFFNEDSLLKTTCDISGNFTFKNVPAGDYYLYVVSKNAIADPWLLYTTFKIYLIDKTERWFKYDWAQDIALRNEIEDTYQKWSLEKNYRAKQKLDKQLTEKIDQLIEKWPSAMKLGLEIFSAKTTKREIKPVVVDSKDQHIAINISGTY